MKWLIAGVSGLLGSNLAWAFRDQARVTGIYCQHPVRLSGVTTTRLNLREERGIGCFLDELQPEVVIHCAGRTDIDALERDADECWESNVLTIANLVAALRGSKAKLILLSDAEVFGGGAGPHHETSSTAPLNRYGAAKLEAEGFALRHPGALILRGRFFGWGIQKNERHTARFIQRLTQGETVPALVDQQASFLYTLDLATIIQNAVAMNLHGLYHCGSQDGASHWQFGCRLAETFALDSKKVKKSPSPRRTSRPTTGRICA